MMQQPAAPGGARCWGLHQFLSNAAAAALAVLCAAQVCVALLCTVQRDLLHAGYLAIVLLFFRQRTSLMTAPARAAGGGGAALAAAAGPQGGAGMGGGLLSGSSADLFLWLPAFNFFVVAATLVYQVGGTAGACMQLWQPWSRLLSACTTRTHAAFARWQATGCKQLTRAAPCCGHARTSVCVVHHAGAAGAAAGSLMG